MRARCPRILLSCLLAQATLVGLAPSRHGSAFAGEPMRVDCSRRIGRIRALHGVNNGPLNFGEIIDLSAYYRQARFPLARLHDCEWPNPDLVDFHTIFPDLRADPTRPESYRFSRTDTYVEAIIKAGTGIVYRLGESIETTRRKYHVVPPADYHQWAAACVGIIRHYNEGWADGFRHGIRYWEIWNEPENRPNMWSGSDDDYYRLYAAAARAIKTRFPQLKVGGPSVGATGDLVDGRLQPTDFVTGFLKYCKAHTLPLDFFSWHTYTDNPHLYAQKGHAIRKLLDAHGFTTTENHLNEWNYLPNNDWRPLSLEGQGLMRQRFYETIGGPAGAAFLACTLIYLQDSPVDMANYYCGETNQFGLFNAYGTPKKTFHAMRAFAKLLDTPVRLATSGQQPGQTALCAGASEDATRVAVLVSNFRSASRTFHLDIQSVPWQGASRWEMLRLDATQDLAPGGSGTFEGPQARITVELAAPCLAVVTLTPVRAVSGR